MAKEIERKYLVKNEIWDIIIKPNFTLMHQGYIMDAGGTTIRVRYTDEKGFLTIKSNQNGISRDEFEYEIPFDDAVNIYENLCSKKLIKRRYKITYFEKLWEVDVYLGKLEGLIIAEIELNSEEETILERPIWIGDEISYDTKYSNASLAS
jgi:CYTH domain-containing protein